MANTVFGELTADASGFVTLTNPLVLSNSNAAGLAVGPNGNTNPALRVVNNVASAATGLSITANAAGSGVTITVLSSGSNENLQISPKGTGKVGIGTSSPQTLLDIRATDAQCQVGTGTASVLVATQAGFAIDQDSKQFVFGVQTGTAFCFTGTKTNTDFILTTNDNERVRITASGNMGLGATAAGTNGVKVFFVGNGTAPTTSPADLWQGYSADWNGAGTAAPHFRTEDNTIYRLGGTAFSTSTNAAASLGTAAEGFTQLFLDQTQTAGGTTGNQTINKSAGSVNFAGGATSLTVTCNKCTASSIVICTVLTNDTTATIKNVVPASGSFVITLGAAATAETKVGFLVINQ